MSARTSRKRRKTTPRSRKSARTSGGKRSTGWVIVVVAVAMLAAGHGCDGADNAGPQPRPTVTATP